jgi:hypothetical protein
MQVLREEYGWARVFRLDDDGSYPLLGPNPCGTGPLKGKLSFRDGSSTFDTISLSVGDPKSGTYCILIVGAEPMIEGMGAQALKAFSASLDAFVQNLALSIVDVVEHDRGLN